MGSGLTYETSESTSSSLLGRLRCRDAAAWTRLTGIYSPHVYRWARQAGLQESDASDLAQEVFRVVTTRIDDFRREKPGDSFRGWLWGITSNKLKEYFRQQAARPQATGGTEAQIRLNSLLETPPEDSDASEVLNTNTSLIHRAIDLIRTEFEEKTWRAFWRTAIDEQKATDIAAELEMTSAAVRQAKCRVLRRLRQEMEDLA